MDLRCTCGAVLPNDARFCHKCGKPQYEEDLARLSAENTAAPVQAPLDVPGERKAAPIGFANTRALAITIIVAALALFPFFLAFIAPPLTLLVAAGAGYCAAYFYRKQSSQPLTAGGGAFLGVMTGLWLFLVVALGIAAFRIEVSTPQGLAIVQAYAAKMPEAAKLLEDPQQLQAALIQALVILFFLATVSAAFGGMLAARTLARRSQP